MIQRLWNVLFAVTAVWLTPSNLLAQCAMCRESIDASSGGGQGDLGAGFSWAVLFMLGMFFSLLAAVVGLFIYASRGVAISQRPPERSETASPAAV